MAAVLAETRVGPDPAAVARGAKRYANHRLSCHRNDGVGEPPIPWGIRRRDLIEAMTLNETFHAWDHGDGQPISMIPDGTPRSHVRTPVFRDVLSSGEAADLVAYIKSSRSDRTLACQGPGHMRCV